MGGRGSGGAGGGGARGGGGGAAGGSRQASTPITNPSDLRRGEEYEVRRRGEYVEMTYVGGSVVSGNAVRDFRFTENGKSRILRLDNDDVTRLVRKRRR